MQLDLVIYSAYSYTYNYYEMSQLFSYRVNVFCIVAI